MAEVGAHRDRCRPILDTIAKNPKPMQLGDYFVPAASGVAMNGEPPLMVAQRQGGASAAVHRASSAPPSAGAVSAAEHAGDLGCRLVAAGAGVKSAAGYRAFGLGRARQRTGAVLHRHCVNPPGPVG
jgi:hypothetical protein